MKDNNDYILPKSLIGFYLKHAIKKQWCLIGAWFVFFLITSLNEVFWPISQKWTIALFENKVPENMNFLQYALPTILLIGGIFVALDIAILFKNLFHSRLLPIINNQISEKLNNYVQHQSMRFWASGMSGKVSSQINYVASGIRVMEDFCKIICTFIVICINAGLIIQINKWIACVFAFSFIFRFVYSCFLIKPMNHAAEEASSAQSSLSGQIIDSISNYYIVKLFAGADKEQEHLKAPRKKQIKTSIHSMFVQRFFWGVPMFLWEILYAIVLIICCSLFADNQIKVSEVVFTISVYCTVSGLISSIIQKIPDIVDGIGSANKAYKELVVPIDVMDKPNADILNVSRGKIELKNISFKYKNKYVLRNFSLDIKPGERIGIVGPSGAGKTTLVNLIMRLYNPTKGEILIDNQNIADVTQKSLRENISFIPQSPTMFNRSIRENIAYGKDNATEKEIKRSAKLASADKFICETEKKYETLVGERGIKLSGGQSQRIAIARAFLKNAPILILDEATSALDSETEVAIQSSFEKLSSGRTTIAIAHRLSTLRNMDRIIVIDNGRVIESGTHNALLRKHGVYEKLWKMQSGGFIQE